MKPAVDQKKSREAAQVFSAPSKTFLLGEYVALDGGPSLVLSTGPRFGLRVLPAPGASGLSRLLRTQRSQKAFAPQSPAGRWLTKLGSRASDFVFEFQDPHRGKGGLGASSAQFALLYSWSELARDKELSSSSGADWARVLETYRECAWSGEGTPPSGADVVAQMTGGISCFDGAKLAVEKLDWKFSSLSFSLLRTGVKLATHEHLKKSKAAATPQSIAALRECVALGKHALRSGDETEMCLAVERAGSVLSETGLTSPATIGLLSALRAQVPSLRAAKGCGAMGADVIIVLHDREKSGVIAAWAKSKGLELCGTEADLDREGVRIE